MGNNASDSNSTTKIEGSQGGGTSTTKDDAKDVGTQANRILSMSGLPKLYSICYGSVGDDHVADHKPFGNWTDAKPATTENMTIEQWLDAFSTEAFDGADGDVDGLFATFNTIISQIQLATQAWKVDDTMGTHMTEFVEVDSANKNEASFDTTTNKLHWDVLRSTLDGTTTETVNGVEYTILKYIYKYKIKLDNLDTSYTGNSATDTNAEATLTYAVKGTDGLWNKVQDPVAFPEPEVKGYVGSLTFKKGWLDGETFKPMANVAFTLTSEEKSAEGNTWTATATSAEDGTVTFTGIPSGHIYALTETVPSEAYKAPGDMSVSVNWGETTFSKMNSAGQFINELTDKSVTLVLKKEFNSTEHPDSITFTIVNTAANYYREVTLPTTDGKWEITLPGLTPGTYVISENAAWDGYDLTQQSATLDGNALTVQYNNVKPALTLGEGESHKTYTVVFTNAYQKQVGSVSVTKTFWERNHDDLISGNTTNPQLEKLDNSLYAGMEITVDLINAAGKSEKILTLDNNNNWTVRNVVLPVGEYTISENVQGVIPDHDYVHLHIKVNGTAIEGNKITIGKDDEITLALENHYTHHMGDIRVEKLINGIAADDIPEGTKFYVDVYNTKADADANETPVTTIEVVKLVDGNWSGTSRDLPVGQYYLKERTTTIDGYNFISGVFSLTDNTVTVSKPTEINQTGTTTVVLTNTYEQQKGRLTVNKVFDLSKLTETETAEFDYPDYITVNVLDGDASGDVVATLTLATDNNWTDTVELPVGNYYLSEVTAEGVAGTADVPNYGLNATWDSVTVVITDDENVSRQVTNTYTRDYGSLTINKSLIGTPNDNATITFVVYKKNADSTRGDVVESIVLPNVDATDANKWTKTVNLVPGDYYLYEYGAHNAFTNYTLTSVTFNGTDWYKVGDVMKEVTGYSFTIEKDKTVTVNAVNTYVQDTADLTIKKAFAGDLNAADFVDKTITVRLKQNDVEVAGKSPITLNATNSWSHTVEDLPVGSYTLEEDTSTVHVTGYNLSASWSDGASVNLTKGNDVTKTLTNTYTQQTGKLSL